MFRCFVGTSGLLALLVGKFEQVAHSQSSKDRGSMTTTKQMSLIFFDQFRSSDAMMHCVARSSLAFNHGSLQKSLGEMMTYDREIPGSDLC